MHIFKLKVQNCLIQQSSDFYIANHRHRVHTKLYVLNCDNWEWYIKNKAMLPSLKRNKTNLNKKHFFSNFRPEPDSVLIDKETCFGDTEILPHSIDQMNIAGKVSHHSPIWIWQFKQSDHYYVHVQGADHARSNCQTVAFTESLGILSSP